MGTFQSPAAYSARLAQRNRNWRNCWLYSASKLWPRAEKNKDWTESEAARAWVSSPEGRTRLGETRVLCCSSSRRFSTVLYYVLSAGPSAGGENGCQRMRRKRQPSKLIIKLTDSRQSSFPRKVSLLTMSTMKGKWSKMFKTENFSKTRWLTWAFKRIQTDLNACVQVQRRHFGSQLNRWFIHSLYICLML